MRRPNFLLRGLLLACLLLVVGQSVVLTRVAPRHVLRAIERAAGGKLVVGKAHLSFPLTTTLTELRLFDNTAESAFSIQRVVIRPRWVSLPTRTLYVESLELERPLLRLTRTKEGTIFWPRLAQPVSAVASAAPSAWRIHIGTLSIASGVVEFIDGRPATPFHGLLDHVSLILGPITVPASGAQSSGDTPPTGLDAEGLGMSFAVRGKLIGHGGDAAPIYCSGWLDLAAQDLQASCQLEPLALAAFEPYYHGPAELRVYTTTLKATSQWWARSNQFTGRLQLELNHLGEGDLSVHGRTIVDVKQMAGGTESRLTGAISLSGLLDHPWEWQAEFLPGDDRVQTLVERLREHGVAIIKVPLGQHRLHVSITPSTKAAMTDIEATAKEIQEALEILAAPPIPEELATPEPSPVTEASTEPTAPSTVPTTEGSAVPSPSAASEPDVAVPPPPSVMPPPQMGGPATPEATAPRN